MLHRSDFGTPCCLRPTEAGSALGSTPFEATFTFTVVTARQLVVPQGGVISPLLSNLYLTEVGERRVGKPHTAFDVAGTGNVARSK
jgi:hypothetical protein